MRGCGREGVKGDEVEAGAGVGCGLVAPRKGEERKEVMKETGVELCVAAGVDA